MPLHSFDDANKGRSFEIICIFLKVLANQNQLPDFFDFELYKKFAQSEIVEKR